MLGFFQKSYWGCKRLSYHKLYSNRESHGQGHGQLDGNRACTGSFLGEAWYIPNMHIMVAELKFLDLLTSCANAQVKGAFTQRTANRVAEPGSEQGPLTWLLLLLSLLYYYYCCYHDFYCCYYCESNLVIDITVVLLRNIIISIRTTIWGCCLIAQFGWRSARLDSSLQIPGHLAFK